MQTVPHVAQSYKPTAYHATFEGIHGQAQRDAQGAVWFLGDDGSRTLLHRVDAPYVQLFGHVESAQEQRLLDDAHGSLYACVDHRISHRARKAA